MSKRNEDKTEKYLMSLTKQKLVGIIMTRPETVYLQESNKNKDKLIKELEQENARLGNLCDKLNKDYFEQKNIAAHALKELATQIREQKLYETRTCNLDKNYLCSLCGASQADIRKKYSNFCSNCGAKIIE